MPAKESQQPKVDIFDQVFHALPIDDVIDPETKSFTLLFPFRDDSPSGESAIATALSLHKSLPKLDRASEQIKSLLLEPGGCITFEPNVLNYRAETDIRCSHTLVVTQDPVEPSKIHLACLALSTPENSPEQPTCFSTNSYGALQVNEKFLEELIKQSPGKTIALFPVMTSLPCMSELAELQRVRTYLAEKGWEIFISPAQICRHSKDRPLISYYQGEWNCTQVGAQRENLLIKNFQEVLRKFADEIRNAPQIRRSHNDTHQRFTRQLLSMQTKLAVEFYSNHLKSKNLFNSILSFGKNNVSDRAQQLRVGEFAEHLKSIREEIFKLNTPTASKLAQFGRSIALSLAQTLTKDFINLEYLHKDEILTSETPIRITTKTYSPGCPPPPREIRNIAFEVSLQQSHHPKTEMIEQCKSLGILLTSPKYDLPTLSDYSALLHHPKGTSLLTIGKFHGGLTPYQGFAFNPALTIDGCQSALFAAQQMTTVVETATEAWNRRQTDWKLKGTNLLRALDDRLNTQLEALTSLELEDAAAGYKKVIRENISQLKIKQTSSITLDKVVPLTEEAPQLNHAVNQYLLNSGVIVPAYFTSADGSRLSALPIRIGGSTTEVFVNRMIENGGQSDSKDWYPPAQIELARTFWAPFSEHPEIFRAAAHAIQAGMKLSEVFPETSIETLIALKDRVIEASSKIGPKALGERLISTKARSLLGISAQRPAVNEDMIVNACVQSVIAASEFINKQALVAQKLSLNEMLKTIAQLKDTDPQAYKDAHPDDTANTVVLLASASIKALSELRVSLNSLQNAHDKAFRKKIGTVPLQRSDIPVLISNCIALSKELNEVITKLTPVGIPQLIDLVINSADIQPKTEEDVPVITDKNEMNQPENDFIPVESTRTIDDQLSEPEGAIELLEFEIRANAPQDAAEGINLISVETAPVDATENDQEQERLIEEELEFMWEDGGMGEEFIKLEMLGSTVTEAEFKDLFRRYKRAIGKGFLAIAVESKGTENDLSRINGEVLELNGDRVQELTSEYINELGLNLKEGVHSSDSASQK